MTGPSQNRPPLVVTSTLPRLPLEKEALLLQKTQRKLERAAKVSPRLGLRKGRER